jgi:hypothetical protein
VYIKFVVYAYDEPSITLVFVLMELGAVLWVGRYSAERRFCCMLSSVVGSSVVGQSGVKRGSFCFLPAGKLYLVRSMQI